VKIEIRQGDDWAEVFVDGHPREQGHTVPRHFLYDLLREAGAKVFEPDGDFCGCGEWWPEGTRCEDCA
jgi:hypothetical protein